MVNRPNLNLIPAKNISSETPMIIMTSISGYKFQKEIITPQGIVLKQLMSAYDTYNFGLDGDKGDGNIIRPQFTGVNCRDAPIGTDVAVLDVQTIQSYFSSIIPTIYYMSDTSEIIEADRGVLTPCGLGYLDNPLLYIFVLGSFGFTIDEMLGRLRATRDCEAEMRAAAA